MNEIDIDLPYWKDIVLKEVSMDTVPEEIAWEHYEELDEELD